MTLTDAGTPTEAPDRSDSPKRRRFRPRFPRRIAVLVWAVIAVLLVGATAWLLSWQSPVPVRDVVVVGASADSVAAVTEAAAVPQGVPLRDVRRAEIAERVLALPGINGVEVNLKRPWTVAVVVDERFAFAQVRSDAGYTVVDSQGDRIRDAETKQRKLPEIGGAQESRGTSFEVLGGLPEDLVSSVATITTDEDGNVTLTLRDRTVVELGQPTEIDRKAQLVVALLKTDPEVVNVATPERPALEGDLKLDEKNQPDPEADGQ